MAVFPSRRFVSTDSMFKDVLSIWTFCLNTVDIHDHVQTQVYVQVYAYVRVNVHVHVQWTSTQTLTGVRT
jgi:hypothetical protein